MIHFPASVHDEPCSKLQRHVHSRELNHVDLPLIMVPATWFGYDDRQAVLETSPRCAPTGGSLLSASVLGHPRIYFAFVHQMQT